LSAYIGTPISLVYLTTEAASMKTDTALIRVRWLKLLGFVDFSQSCILWSEYDWRTSATQASTGVTVNQCTSKEEDKENGKNS